MERYHVLKLPIIVFLLLFGVLLPLTTYVLSLYKWYLPSPNGPSFIGLENYVKLLSDPYFLSSLINSVFFAFTAMPSELLLGLGLASYLHNRIVFNSRLYRLVISVISIPLIISPLVTGILLIILKSKVSGFLSRIGINIYAGQWALPLIVLADIWQWTPFVFLIFLMRLHAIPAEYFEAAEVDGASSLLIFRKLVLPSLSSTVLVVALLRGVDAFRVLDIIFTTQGGPVSETVTVNFYIFKMFFAFSEIGYGSALTVFLTLVTLIPVPIFLIYIIIKRREIL